MRYAMVLIAAPLLISPHAFSQSTQDEAANFPTKPVQIIVPFPPGGGSEAFARSIAAKLTQLNYGSPGNGTPPHLQMEVFNRLARVKMTHVPYKGGGPANVALLSGEVQLAFTAVTVGLPHIEAGKLRALGLSGAKKPASLSGFPTVAESGLPGYDENTWACSGLQACRRRY